ncbi:MAG: hypothetical protein Q4Q07_04450 [Tissierellia bacterium]|nr:hypothetical protein [Tissierellia bacterium]
MPELMKYIRQFPYILITYVIPIVSFGFSVLALYRANKSRNTDNRIKELELYIKEHEAEKIKQIQNIPKRAKIEAKVIKISTGEYRAKFWNSGNITAYNIKASIPKDSGVLLIDTKFPYEYLEPEDSFEEHVIIHSGSQPKFEIIIEWQDKEGKDYTNTQLRSI